MATSVCTPACCSRAPSPPGSVSASSLTAGTPVSEGAAERALAALGHQLGAAAEQRPALSQKPDARAAGGCRRRGCQISKRRTIGVASADRKAIT